MYDFSLNKPGEVMSSGVSPHCNYSESIKYGILISKVGCSLLMFLI